jgi:DNA-binding transcriptional LysR family regulator
MSYAGKDLNLLIALRALLEEENVSRAGERIGMGQSSMSSALARLRTQFNDELLVRVGRDYQLTPMARQILPQVQLTIPLIERALGSGGPFDPATSTRVFSVMCSDYAALELAPRFAEALAAAPNIRIEVSPLPENPTDSGRDLLTHDFVIAVPGIGIDGEHKELWIDDYVVVLDPANKAIVDGAITWDAFTELPQAVSDFGQAHLTPAERRMRELGFSRAPHVTTSSFLPLPSVVVGTDLAGVLPRRLAERFAALSPIAIIEAPFGRVEIRETLYWHTAHNADTAHEWLKDILSR